MYVKVKLVTEKSFPYFKTSLIYKWFENIYRNKYLTVMRHWNHLPLDKCIHKVWSATWWQCLSSVSLVPCALRACPTMEINTLLPLLNVSYRKKKKKIRSWINYYVSDEVDLCSQTGCLSRTAIGHFQTRLHTFKLFSSGLSFLRTFIYYLY